MARKKLLKTSGKQSSTNDYNNAIATPDLTSDEPVIVIGPSSRKQEMFLSCDADIIVYGGAMGGGKSYMGLVRHLRWVEDPNYRGYIIRKNQTTLMKSGGLFDEAYTLFKQYDPRVKANKKAMSFTFPSGAVVSMGHCETDNDAEKWRGLQISAAMVDEATQLQESHVMMILSRLRSKAKMKPNLFLTCNPDPDSFIRKWIDWWILPKGHEFEGRPDEDRCGKVRWFVRLNNEMCWGDTREELLDRYGNDVLPLSMCFINATIYDNPILLRTNPGYLANLQGLPRVKRERDLFGSWNVREEKSTFFQREWVKEANYEPAHTDILRTVRAYDFAGTLKSETDNSPDYTACVKMSKLKDGSYFVHDVQRIRIRFGDWEDFILRNAYKDGKNTTIVLPLDPSIAAKEATKLTRIRLIEHGYNVSTRRASQNKVDRFRTFSALAQNGDVSFLANCGTDYENNIYNSLDFVYSELENFDGKRHNSERFHDDQVDAFSDAVSELASKMVIPPFSVGLTEMMSLGNTGNPFARHY